MSFLPQSTLDAQGVALYRITCACTLCTYYIYTLYGIQDPGPWIHVTVYTDPYPVPHETTNTVYH